MDSPEENRGYTKWDTEEGLDVKSDRVGDDDDDWEGIDKRKHRSSRSRKSGGNADEAEGLDGRGRKSNGDRKRSSGSSRADSDEDDYDSRKESSSSRVKAAAKKKPEESSLDKLSSFYRDGDVENSKQDKGDKSGGKESERRRPASKDPDLDGSSQGRSKSKEDSFDDGESKYLDKRESGREKSHGSSEQARSSRRRWDETDVGKKGEEGNSDRGDSRSIKVSDPTKYESPRVKNVSARNEIAENRGKGSDPGVDKSTKVNIREERKGDVERSKGKGKSDPVEQDGRGSPVAREERSTRDKVERQKLQRSSGRDGSENRERSYNADEEKGAKEAGNTNRSRTPERSGRRQHDSDYSDMDYERSYKRKELEKDGHKDDRSKGKDESWSERSSRDREGSKESWKRRQVSGNDKDTKNGDVNYEHGRDWEIPRHGRDRGDNDRLHGRPGNRKDGNRNEAVKTSSNFGISNENYDVIEIQTKPLDYGRTESGSNFSRRSDISQQPDVKLASNDEDWSYSQDDRSRRSDYGEETKERYQDNGSVAGRDQNSRRDEFDYHGGKGRGLKPIMSGRSNMGGQISGTGSQPPYGNQEPGSYSRSSMQGMKGNNRLGRGGRGRPSGRDGQQVAIPLPIMASPFGPLGMPPPGPMQPLNPTMSPAPGPPISPGVFIPPFSPPVWHGGRGVDMNMLAIPPGPSGPRFSPSMVSAPNPMYFNPSGPGRGSGPPNIPVSSFNASGTMGSRGNLADKPPGGWAPPKSNGPPGKAPSRGEQNDYSQNFVDTGMRPQNFIRELELTNVVEDYPKLRELIQKKDEIVAKSASTPMYYQCDLKEFELSPEFFGTKFDVILVDPPWEEYVHRAPGVADHMEYWTFEEIMNLKIEAIADTPSFIFLWVGDGVGLEQGRQCIKKWGFRRCEDICWVKTNKNNATPGLRHDSHTLFQHSKEHCLMGIKGTVRRSTDGHIIHANIDTDVIIADEPPYGSTQKPEDMYRIIEHFALGRRRLELFGEDHNIRSGWLTVGKGLSSSNFNSEAYTRSFGDKDGKVWQGGGGRNPPPEAPHLVVTTPEIEALRPKSPMKNQQQLQQQTSASISLTSATSSNRRATGNSPQNPNVFSLNQEPSSNPANAAPWAPDDKIFDMYMHGGRGNGDFIDFEAHRQMNLL